MKIFSAYSVLLLWTCLTMSAQTTETYPADKDLQAKIEALISDATFEQAVVGISACTADGRPLAGINGGTMLVPASNMKLISTGAALHALGPDYRYETRIGYSGTIEDGTLKGNLYIIVHSGSRHLLLFRSQHRTMVIFPLRSHLRRRQV